MPTSFILCPCRPIRTNRVKPSASLLLDPPPTSLQIAAPLSTQSLVYRQMPRHLVASRLQDLQPSILRLRAVALVPTRFVPHSQAIAISTHFATSPTPSITRFRFQLTVGLAICR